MQVLYYLAWERRHNSKLNNFLSEHTIRLFLHIEFRRLSRLVAGKVSHCQDWRLARRPRSTRRCRGGSSRPRERPATAEEPAARAADRADQAEPEEPAGRLVAGEAPEAAAAALEAEAADPGARGLGAGTAVTRTHTGPPLARALAQAQ
jgi:hypothetical protein